MTSLELSFPNDSTSIPDREVSADLQDSDRARRFLNVSVAVVGLIVAAPLLLLIAVLVRLSSRGPVIYKQTRVGLDRRKAGAWRDGRRQADQGGRPFTMYKFRTMRADPAPRAETWALQNDPRVTTLGRILRKYRLDELPQLVNVMLGDMNIVGPRPEQPTIFAKLRDEVQGYQDRQRVPPGITGWAQINHHYDSSVDDVRRKVAFDLEYVQRCSALEDLRIMVRTLPVMVFKQGAW